MLTDILKKVENQQTVKIQDVIDLIDVAYEFESCGFYNGKFEYDASEKQDLCKLLAFGKMNKLSKEEFIISFSAELSKTYPDDLDVFNITGWSGVLFFNKMPIKNTKEESC